MLKGLRMFFGGAQAGGGDLVTISVGKPHPYLPSPPHDATSLTLTGGFLTFSSFLTPPLDVEIASLGGLCIACGLCSSAECGGALPIFAFQAPGSDGAWMIKAPLVASREEVDAWIASDTNIVRFQLMETGTGIVRVLRTIGAGKDFLRGFKEAMRHTKHPVDVDGYPRLLSRLGEDGLWANARRWIYDARHEQFVRAP